LPGTRFIDGEPFIVKGELNAPRGDPERWTAIAGTIQPVSIPLTYRFRTRPRRAESIGATGAEHQRSNHLP